MRWRLRRRAADSGQPEAPLSAERAFAIVYGRLPAPSEAATLRQLGPSPLRGDGAMLRAVIGAFDHQKLPTPVGIRCTEADLQTVDLNDFRLVIDRHDVSVSEPISRGDYEPHVADFFRRSVKPGMTAIDVGANIGVHTMLLATLVTAAGKVLAFEPDSENCRLLLLSIAANGFAQVTVHPCALAAETGPVTFGRHLGSNGGLLSAAASRLLDPNCRVVPALPLDLLVPDAAVDFLKIDVEGAEFLVLRGAENLLRRCRPVIVAEFSLEMLERVSGIAGADFLYWMTGLGYRICPLPRDGSPVRPIATVDTFLADWGDHLRIEDLAFVPAERDCP